MLRHTIVVVTILFISSVATAAPDKSYTWNRLADGLFYTTYSFAIGDEEASSIHAFQIDPKKYRLDVVTSSNEQEGSTATQLAKSNKTLLVINGGFFTPEHKSIGLIIKDGRELNPIHNTSWWSIFAITGNEVKIFTPKEFRNAKDVRMALQVGPRLVVDGNIPKLKESLATRSAVGITKDGKIIIAITQGLGVSMNEMAKRMKAPKSEGGLECPNAMALDGGSSSQIYAKVKKFELSLPGIAYVTNGLAVIPKNP